MKKSIFVLFLSSIMVLTPVLGVFADTEADGAVDDGIQVEEQVQEKPEAAPEEDVAEPEQTEEDSSAPATEEETAEAEEDAVVEEAVPENNTAEGDEAEAESPLRTPEEQIEAEENSDGVDCSHEDTYTSVEFIGEVTYESIDDKFHSRSGKAIVYTYCDSCGELISSEEIEDYLDTEYHEYDDDGICIICGHENACTHTGETFVDEEIDWETAEYTAIDGREHLITATMMVSGYCSDCNEKLWFNEEEYTDTESHYFNEDGICEHCGYVNDCEHPDTYTFLEFEDEVTYQYKDSRYHTAIGAAYEVTYCDICGQQLSREFVEDASEEQWHHFEDGVCEYCGYENQCEHSHTYTYESFYDPEYEAVDELTHSVSGYADEITECNDCWEILSEEPLGEIVRYWEHEFEDGVCQQCGYENQCEHKNTDTWLDFDEDASYESIDNKYHLVSGNAYEITYCNDCGERLSKEPVGESSEKQWHDYNKDGICEVCGYENQCEHENTYTWLRFDEDASYESIDNKYHLASGDAYKVTICDDCGQDLSEEPIGNTSEEQWHDYNSNGVCRVCGHVNDCEHEETYTWLRFDEDAVYESIDNTHHLVSGIAYEDTYCEDCEERLSSEYVGNTSEERWHDYNSNGVCRLCGHVNDCEHENQDNGVYFPEGAAYESVDDRCHLATGKAYKEIWCMDCGMTLSEEYLGETTEEEPHYYEDGVCQQCGHVNSCTHPSGSQHSHYGYNHDEVDIEYKDSEYHTVTGIVYHITECELCGEVLEANKIEGTSVDEEHYYDEDGVCTRCGHTETPIPEGFSQDENGNWYYYDENGNAAKGWKQIDGNWYYMDPSTGIRKSGWLNDGGKWYYLDPEYNDEMVSDSWCKVSSKWYYFDPNGAMHTGWLKEEYNYGGKVETYWYYFNTDGSQVYGWKKIGNVWYYFEEYEEDGLMATGTWYVDSSKKTYLFNKDGVWQETTTAWIQEYGIWYYFEKGVAKTGWQQIGGEWYFFDPYGEMYANQWAKDSGGWYWMDTNGKIAKDKWIQYEGDWYYLKSNGYRATNEWAKDSGGWYWMDGNGLITTDSWIKLGNERYYLKENGYMAANEWAEDNGNKYWMDGSGKISRSKWIMADGEWYYMDANGLVTVNAWVKDSTGWMYLDDEGKITKNDWAKDSTGWCWLGSDGYITKSKWVLYEGDWYYINANGYRAESKWEKDSKGWCYLDADGKMVTDDWAKDSVGWCWIGSDGYIVYSQWVNNGNSYVDNRGYRVTGKQVIDGRTYEFDANGILIG